ncbi:hypothetical protein CPLU01_11550 [Colletotrichum plurivorum]|uniref:Uncharacterized protein n=1 Tax=Colletotrichum plurivorum TaxID=2175906 RepID=A0A8H6K1S6_9PEZI|nr:hypothetical protein CPLU01_11550 [Colletotrichum plurivorum]
MAFPHIIYDKYFLGLAAAVPAFLAAKHVWDVYRRVSHVPRSRVVEKNGVSESFGKSHTLESLVNPRQHVFVGDMRHVELFLSRHVKDETILAAFVGAFFGGKVFAPERMALEIVGKRFTSFSGLGPEDDIDRISNNADVPRGNLPALRAMLFGTFQVSHIHIDKDAASGETTSSIDFVYGSDQGRFAGAHRFSIMRDRSQAKAIRVVFESASCNPTQNRPFAPAFLFSFHRLYAMLLFRESTANILDILNDGTSTAVTFEDRESVPR